MKDRKQLESVVIEKAVKDLNIRKSLLENPKSVIEKETGLKIPLSVNVTIVEEDPGKVYLVLPYIQAPSSKSELDEPEIIKKNL